MLGHCEGIFPILICHSGALNLFSAVNPKLEVLALWLYPYRDFLSGQGEGGLIWEQIISKVNVENVFHVFNSVGGIFVTLRNTFTINGHYCVVNERFTVNHSFGFFYALYVNYTALDFAVFFVFNAVAKNKVLGVGICA